MLLCDKYSTFYGKLFMENLNLYGKLFMKNFLWKNVYGHFLWNTFYEKLFIENCLNI